MLLHHKHHSKVMDYVSNARTHREMGEYNFATHHEAKAKELQADRDITEIAKDIRAEVKHRGGIFGVRCNKQWKDRQVMYVRGGWGFPGYQPDKTKAFYEWLQRYCKVSGLELISPPLPIDDYTIVKPL